MKVNEYKVLQDCIERGISIGYSRAFKHTDTPSDQAIKSAIEDAVMLEICEYFEFDEVKDDAE